MQKISNPPQDPKYTSPALATPNPPHADLSLSLPIAFWVAVLAVQSLFLADTGAC